MTITEIAAPAKVLIAGGSKERRLRLKKILGTPGAELMSIDMDGSCLPLIESQNYSVIILEASSGDERIWDLMMELRRSAKTSHIPVIVSVAQNEFYPRMMASLLGASFYVTNRTDRDELKFAVALAADESSRTLRVS